VELGGHLCHVWLEGAKGIGDRVQKRRYQEDTHRSVEQVSDRQAIARRITPTGALEKGVDGGS
jgi:hypothetical protein